MLTEGIQVMKYVRASAGRAGLGVVFEDCNRPRHDSKTIYLPKITWKTTKRELQQLMASTDHEVAHDRYSCFDVLKEKGIDPMSLLMFTWNFLEDSRVNNIEAREYKGFKDNWDDCSADLVREILNKASKEPSLMTKVISNLICWEADICSSTFPLIQLATSGFTPNKEVQDVLTRFSSRLLDSHFILDKRLGTTATYEIAYDILKALSIKLEEKPKETPCEGDKPTSTKKKKASAGTESDGESPEELGTSKSEDGETKDDVLEEDDDTEYKIVKVLVTKEDLEKFSITSPEEGKEMGRIGLNSDPVALGGGTWDLTDFDKFLVVDYPKHIGAKHYLDSHAHAAGFKYGYEERCGKFLIKQENFAQQVRRLIQIRAKVQTQYGTKKGKLDQSRLSRICFNAPGFSEKVFKTRIENTTLDAAMTVLVDMSGSMNGEKAYFALASTLLLNEVCSTLNIPLEVLGFTDGYAVDGYRREAVPLMFIYKSFNSLKVSSEDMIDYFATSSKHMDGNPDGENILWAYERLLKRKEKKRLLVVMSDGTPMASKSSFGLEEFTRKSIQEIERAKMVNIYGLGLCHDAVKHYYKANSVVSRPDEIPTMLLQLIEKRILNV